MAAIDVVEAMIEETTNQKRKYPSPLMGGGHQAPFDGEEMGKQIRLAILIEVRDRIKESA